MPRMCHQLSLPCGGWPLWMGGPVATRLERRPHLPRRQSCIVASRAYMRGERAQISLLLKEPGRRSSRLSCRMPPPQSFEYPRESVRRVGFKPTRPQTCEPEPCSVRHIEPISPTAQFLMVLQLSPRSAHLAHVLYGFACLGTMVLPASAQIPHVVACPMATHDSTWDGFA